MPFNTRLMSLPSKFLMYSVYIEGEDKVVLALN